MSDESPRVVARAGKYTIVGCIVTLFNFVVYTIIAQVVIQNNDFLWIDSIVAYIMAAILAYILHSKVTWRERRPSRRGIVMFFIWNLAGALIISPLLTKIFGLIEPLYQFIYNIVSVLHLPFNYDFVESTSIFCLTTLVTMILNYLFYDKLVFGGD